MIFSHIRKMYLDNIILRTGTSHSKERATYLDWILGSNTLYWINEWWPKMRCVCLMVLNNTVCVATTFEISFHQNVDDNLFLFPHKNTPNLWVALLLKCLSSSKLWALRCLDLDFFSGFRVTPKSSSAFGQFESSESDHGNFFTSCNLLWITQ